jgi:hypothetical protein
MLDVHVVEMGQQGPEEGALRQDDPVGRALRRRRRDRAFAAHPAVQPQELLVVGLAHRRWPRWELGLRRNQCRAVL